MPRRAKYVKLVTVPSQNGNKGRYHCRKPVQRNGRYPGVDGPENGKVKERMEAYTGFAQVYDIFMDNVPYEEWAEYLTSLLREYGVDSGLVLDLGCGTGSMTEILAADGYGYDRRG